MSGFFKGREGLIVARAGCRKWIWFGDPYYGVDIGLSGGCYWMRDGDIELV